MNKFKLSFIIVLFFEISAPAQVKLPAASSTQVITQDFGLGTIELSYSRPNARERKIFGDLVPLDKLWRTGANAATKIKFTDPVEIGGRRIDTGTYVLYTIPGVDKWEIILNKGVTNWGTEGYKESEDVVHLKAEPMKLRNRHETFTMQFADIKPESCSLQIMWDKTIVAFQISSNVKERLRTQIEKAMQTEKKPYWQAAQFYNEYDINRPKALDYVSKAIAENPKGYWMYLYKANIQKGMGDYTAAKESAKKTLELSREAKNEDYVKMSEALLKELR